MKNRAMDIFQTENGMPIAKLEPIECAIVMYEEYGVEVINGEKFIIGRNLIYCQDRLIDDTDIFFDTYNLAFKMHNAALKHNKRGKDLADSLSVNEIELIINWCVSFGIPLLEHDLANENGVLLAHRKHGFRISVFLHRLDALYEHFEYFDRYYTNFELLGGVVGEDTLLSLAIDFRDNTPVLTWKAIRLIDVPAIQLKFLIASPYRSNIRHCKRCGALFITRGRLEYCNECSPKKAYRERRKDDPILALYDRESGRLRQGKKRGVLSEEEYSNQVKELEEKKEEIVSILDKKEASEQFRTWLELRKYNPRR